MAEIVAASAEMPRYKCHKEVWALKIAKVEQSPADHPFPGGSYRLTFADEGYAPLDVAANWFEKHSPEAGGYYVVYKDGYKSYSPGDAFEDGYTRIPQ